MKVIRMVISAFVALHALSAAASVQTFSGRLDDPGNTALVASDLGLALFASELDIANNVALHPFTLATGGSVDFESFGFVAGGADPYFTLFAGHGNGATFLASNFAIATSVGGDFLITLALAAGDYTVGMGVFENLSFAENLGTGSLGDGFIGLGGPGFLGSSFYSLAVTTTTKPIPLPSSAMLVVLGLGLIVARARRATPLENRRLRDR